ncbi:MAG TPA: hypothetical protein VMZ27_06920 [Candidatus Saccharimonadales bacterium]|nr:hypothetical protein [Candidatus Saccharimonadales bacterium]
MDIDSEIALDNAKEAEVLRCFLAIPENQIAQDLASALGNEKKLTREYGKLTKFICDEPTVPQQVQYSHIDLLLAHVFSQNPDVPVEAAIFRASWALISISNTCCTVTAEQGKLKEFQDRLDEIVKREGLDPDHSWERGEGPADYWSTLDEYYKLSEQVHDVFIAHVMRRYGFREFADLFDDHRMQYDVMKYIGERLMRPAMETWLKKCRMEKLVKDHGPAAMDLYRTLALKYGLNKRSPRRKTGRLPKRNALRNPPF